MATAAYTFLKHANKLGPELNSTLDQIRDLDAEACSLGRKAEDACRTALLQPDYSGRMSNMTTGLKAAIEMQRQVLILSNEKVTLANSLYQAIDKQIRNMDRQRQGMLDDIARREALLGIAPAGPKDGSIIGSGSLPAPAAPSKAKRKRSGKAEEAAAPAPPAAAPPATSGLVQHTFHLPGMEPFEAFIDPSEPKYCSCQQPSWGNMVGCESDTCMYEWFHYACVGLTEAPTSKKWYCPTCRASLEKKVTKRGKLKG